MFDSKPASGTLGNASGTYAQPAPPPTMIYNNIVHDLGPKDAEIGEVAREGRQLEVLLGQLGDEVSYLESRLDTVLRPVPPTASVNGPATPTPPRSRIAEGLAETNRRIQFTIERLQSIRARVDL